MIGKVPMNKQLLSRFAMNKFKFLFLILFSSSLVFGNAYDHELVVPLSTKRDLQNVYVGSFQTLDVEFNEDYLAKLRDVLTFDLNNNGTMFVETQGNEAEKTLQSPNPFSLSFWKRRHLSYIIKAELTSDKMLFTLFSTKTGQSYRAKRSILSGNLVSDRRTMHEIADLIFEEISGEKGISTTRILYAIQIPEETSEGTKWKSEIWESDYDGENARQITQENSYCISPTFIPGSGEFTKNKFAYVNYIKGQPKIYLSSFDQKQGEAWVSLRGNQLLPAFSPRGNMMAFICDASGRADLFVQLLSPNKGLMSKPIRAYSFPNSVQASPTFRPDGKKIAFVSDKDGTPHIYLIDTPYPGMAKMPQPICLTKNYRENTCPAWSPDGTKLAYSAKIDGIRQIMVYDFITREEIQLTYSRSHKENPSWAPNSLHIIYNTVDPSSSELFIINLKQKETVQITNGPGKKHYPSWGL